MGSSNIVLRPKGWVKTGYYFTAPLFIALSIYLLYSILNRGIGFHGSFIFDLCLLIASVTILVSYATSLPVFHQFRITLSDDKIEQEAMRKTVIPYRNIQTVIIQNGGIEIHGNGLLNKIAIGDLYYNYYQAYDLLSAKLKDRNDVIIKGSDRNVKEFREEAENVG